MRISLRIPDSVSNAQAIDACVWAMLNTKVTIRQFLYHKQKKIHILAGSMPMHLFSYGDEVAIKIYTQNKYDRRISIKAYQLQMLLTFSHILLAYRLRRKIVDYMINPKDFAGKIHPTPVTPKPYIPMTTTEKVIRIIEDKFTVNVNPIKPEHHLSHDLELDSLDAVELIMDVEKEFNIFVPDNDAEKIRTVQDLVDYIDKH